MLSDAVQDVGREVDVQVAQEHDAVPVLQQGGQDVATRLVDKQPQAPTISHKGGEQRLLPPAHLDHVHASLEPS